MEHEDFSRPFRFIVTDQYLAVFYKDNKYEICRDHHGRGSLFYLADDDEAIIHNNTYVGILSNHPDYDGDVFHIRKDQDYLKEDGTWSESEKDAVNLQIEPVGDYGEAEPPLPPSLSNPIIDAGNPISANGIDLYHPDKWFSLYAITGDTLWSGDADEYLDKLILGGNPYSDGISFQISKHEGKTRICGRNGKYLTVTMDSEVFQYLDEECKQHTRLSRCSRCMRCYNIGFSPEPQECLELVPKGLPSMFALFDGLSYYRVNCLKASYAEVWRVDSVEEASAFQFVG